MASHEPSVFTLLQDAVRGREVIDQAVGIIMQHHDVDAATARDHLAGTAERSETPLRLVAQILVETGSLP